MAFEVAITDPSVQASIISALGGIVAAAIAAIAAAVIGKQISGRKKLQVALLDAVDDIEFLLAVEQEHCNLHKEVSEEPTHDRKARRLVRIQVAVTGLAVRCRVLSRYVRTWYAHKQRVS